MDKGKLIFIGGAKGAGKTTLLGRLKNEAKVKIINTGEVRRYSLKNGFNFQQVLCDLVLIPDNIVLDTHYAVYWSQGFRKNKLYESLYGLSQSKSLRLALIDVDPHTLLIRRMRDSTKQRTLEFKEIQQELERNRQYFSEYCDCLGVKGYVLVNNDLEQSLKNLKGLFYDG